MTGWQAGENSSAVGLVVGVEADGGRLENWRLSFMRRVQFCQWTIQAKAGHPVLRAAVANITLEALRRKNTTWAAAAGKDGHGGYALSADDVLELTGPAVWTDVVYAYFNDARYFHVSRGSVTWANFTGLETGKRVGDTLVLPITSFSPTAVALGARGLNDPMAFVAHGFQGMCLLAVFSCGVAFVLTGMMYLGSWKGDAARLVGGANSTDGHVEE
jgi:alpha 1,6-mannosyltransferase